MLGIYLFCAILGGGLLAFSVLGAADHDAQVDGGDFDAGHDFDGGHDFDAGHDIDHDFDHDVGHDAGADHDAHFGGAELVLGLFKPRNLIFFLAGFGITGTLLEWLTDASAVGTLVPSLGMGAVGMLLTHGTFLWLKRSDSAVDVLSDNELEGCVGRVVLPLSPGERGRIACSVGGREVYLLARLDAEYQGELAQGREVIVLRVTDTVAEVMPFDNRELPPSTGET